MRGGIKRAGRRGGAARGAETHVSRAAAMRGRLPRSRAAIAVTLDAGPVTPSSVGVGLVAPCFDGRLEVVVGAGR